ncbi:MAG: hypothetical protein J6Y93_04940, partial [Treponema sp.]|nr:hypothetical protein [Treponema sp.]
MIMKKGIILSAILVFSSLVFARGGVLSGAKGKITVIKTQYFDIIYPEESSDSAQSLSEVCDEYYEKICSILNTEPYQRFPVTITPSVKQLNAYFTAVPYNRIVLYDARPDKNLDMYEQTLLSVFYHELTHAVTMNMKSPFWKGFSFVAGDVFNPAWLSLSSFWLEGATVSFESAGEGGRLNDAFSMQLVNAAKIEGKFPSWRDVTGARDTYPGGNDAYIFGAMFAGYLQKKYGMEKYSAFWKQAGTSTSLSFCAGVFEKVYGCSVTEQWKEFEKTVYVPDVQNVFESVSDGKAVIRTCDSFTTETGDVLIAWYDSKSQGLFVKKNAGKAERVLNASGIFAVCFSSDGKALNIGRYAVKDNVKIERGVYNIEKKSYKRIDASLQESKSDKIKYSFHALNDETIKAFWIEKDGLDFSIVLSGLEQKRFSFASVGEKNGIIIHDLHFESGNGGYLSFTFAWCELGKAFESLGRAGRLVYDKETEKCTVFLQNSDVSPGINDFFSAGGKWYAVIQKYEEAPLCVADMNCFSFDEYELEPSEHEEKNVYVQMPEKSVKTAYNPFRYYLKGLRLPAGTAGIYDSDFNELDTASLGLTYITSNPWGDKILTLSGGYSPAEEMTAFSVQFSGGNDSFAYNMNTQYGFDVSSARKQSFSSLECTKYLYRGLVSSFGLKAAGKF